MKKLLKNLITALSVLILCSNIANSKDAKNILFNKIIDSSSVYSEVINLLGLDNLNLKSATKLNLNNSISKTVFTDSVTPFIHDELTEINTWKVSYDSIYLNSAEKNQYNKPMSVTVYLDEENGKLLSIYCQSLILEDTIVFRPPTYLESEKALTSLGEIYLGIPDEKPQISFLEAFEKCFRGNTAKEITGNYVNYKLQDKPVEPAWIIYLRGIDPIPMEFSYEFETTVFRYVVNAKTGKIILSLNSPYPLLYDEIKE